MPFSCHKTALKTTGRQTQEAPVLTGMNQRYEVPRSSATRSVTDVFEMGVITRVDRPHQPTEGGGIHHPPRCRPVEPDASTGARPVRRRLIGVILVPSALGDIA